MRGFRKDRSTVDTVKLVIETAKKVKRAEREGKGFCAFISIDIQKAKWHDKNTALMTKQIPDYLLKLRKQILE